MTITYKYIEGISLINRHICQELKHIQAKSATCLKKEIRSALNEKF